MMSPTSIAPAVLLKQARSGDSEALGQLLERYRSPLKRWGCVQIGAGLRVRLDRSDLVQGIFVKAVRGFAEFRGHTVAEFGAWLWQISTNELVNQVKRNRAPGRDYR